ADAFRPLNGSAVLHDPCSLRHVLKGSDAVQQLLRRIPQLELIPLADNHLCCGAAGDYMLQQPAMADALLADKIESLRRLDARLLLTANIGCSLHLRRGIREAGLDIEVLHPVQLLARQIKADTSL
ncbi:MAG: heterodisulfide reductase-related iron-sulfur binding cluster, partial [Gammaproteobacteria bacterium]